MTFTTEVDGSELGSSRIVPTMHMLWFYWFSLVLPDHVHILVCWLMVLFKRDGAGTNRTGSTAYSIVRSLAPARLVDALDAVVCPVLAVLHVRIDGHFCGTRVAVSGLHNQVGVSLLVFEHLRISFQNKHVLFENPKQIIIEDVALEQLAPGEITVVDGEFEVNPVSVLVVTGLDFIVPMTGHVASVRGFWHWFRPGDVLQI